MKSPKSLKLFLILDYLFGRLGFENYVCLQQKEICEALDLQKSNVSKAIKLLIAKGIILQGPKMGKVSSYRLNSTYGWKGKVTNLSKNLLELVHKRQETK
jgi:predicted transcriptional regulator